MVQAFPRFASVNTFSTTDFPQGISAVFFTQGCPLRCPWCFNPELQVFRPALKEGIVPDIAPSQVKQFFQNRQGLLDAIVLSGGEPLSQPGVDEYLTLAKANGFKTGIHTSGIHPIRLQKNSQLIDWIGLDIKTLPKH